LVVSAEQLCQYLTAAETKVRKVQQLRSRSLGKHSIVPGLKKRKRSKTPPEQIASVDEARYVEQEQRAAKRIKDDDSDYENTSITSASSD
jgi:hypothetical protein